MSNRDRAAEVIYKTLAGKYGDFTIPTDAAQALADASLLAPDLPEPRIDIGEWQEWGHQHGNRVTLHAGMVTVEIPDDISRDLTPDEAREFAAWLSAAADYSEEEKRE